MAAGWSSSTLVPSSSNSSPPLPQTQPDHWRRLVYSSAVPHRVAELPWATVARLVASRKASQVQFGSFHVVGTLALTCCASVRFQNISTMPWNGTPRRLPFQVHCSHELGKKSDRS